MIQKFGLQKTRLTAWLVLIAGMLFTVFAAFQVKQHLEQEATAQFSFICDQVSLNIQNRLNAYALLLRGGSGLFASQTQVNRQTWQSYVDRLEIADSVPGMQAMSFAAVVPQAQLAAHIAQIRAEGYPDYKVVPAGNRVLYAPVIYISPFSVRNQRVFGYDTFAEPVRQVAMVQARDSGQATLTGKLLLQQENGQDVQAGVILFIPVYQSGMPQATVENRRRALIGWLASVYRMNNLMTDILCKLSQFKAVELKIYDGLETVPASLLFDSMRTPHPGVLFTQSRTLNLAGHHWSLLFDQSASAVSYRDFWFTLFSGSLLSWLLFALLHSLVNIRSQAIGIANKLTREIKRSESLLFDSEYRLNFAIDSAGDGVWDWNMLSNAMQFSPLYMSMLGYTTYELPHHADSWLNSVHPDDMARVQQNLDDYLAAKITNYHIELRLRCKDGSYKWILCRGKIALHDTQGKPVRMIGIHSDISRHKHIETQLNDSLLFNSTILARSPSGIAVFQAEGTCIMLNQAYAGTLDTSVETIIMQDFRSNGSWQQSGLVGFADEVLASRQVLRKEVERVTYSGKKVVLECVFSFLVIEEKPHLLLITNDISARVKADQEISLALHQLENKELAKTRFLAAAGHDLRQPLAAANMFLYALRYSGLTPQQNDLILSLMLSMSTFKELLDTLLHVSRLDSNTIKPEFTSINVAELLIWLEQNFSVIAGEKKLSFRLFFPLTRTLMIRSDIGLLKSVLLNLISNAIKFTPEGGILVSARQRGGHILFQVWDTGIGIVDEKIALVFEEFFQVNNQQRDRMHGQGLGLSIVKRTLALLGTEITCHSKSGRGSVFGFCLSCVETSLPPPPQADSSLPDAAFIQGNKFIIVEDDLLVIQATLSWLTIMGASVSCFQSAEAALQHEGIEHADYYIVDYTLGGSMNGIAFLHRLSQKAKKRIKAVLVTGDTSGHSLYETSRCHWPVQYKPVNASALLNSLKAQDESPL